MSFSPMIKNRVPDENVTGVDGYSLVSFDMYDVEGDIDLTKIDAYVNGTLAFSGPSTFIAPYNGSGSSITPKIVDGYNGYELVIDYTGMYTSNTLYTIRAIVEDMDGNKLDDSWSFRTGNKIVSITPSLYEIVLDVEFEQNISGGVAESANYLFTNGMYARYVEPLSNKVVRLWVELFHTHREFTLSTSNILDSYGNVIPSSYNSITFSPFFSSADLANMNGKVRTWRESKVVSADTERVYLAGTKGMDVFHKLISKNTIRWGQIFNNLHSVEALFVANFGGAYHFVDRDPPYLYNLSPGVGEEVSPPGTPILFSVGDVKTSVEPTSLTIYINGNLAFSGGHTGWRNGYSGYVIIVAQGLEVVIKPPYSFVIGDDVTVRVRASDLLGNTLDTSYTYYVRTPVAPKKGWGFASFGLTDFGFGDL